MESDASHGLTTDQAASQRARFGLNRVDYSKSPSALRTFLLNFANPLILLLIATAFVSSYFGDYRSALTIGVMIMLSAVLDFVNTYRANKAAVRLKDTIKLTARVQRDGTWQDLAISSIVPDDLIELKAGDIVPADGQIVGASHCYFNEAALTGESFPSAKAVGGEIYMGASVVSGEAQFKVTRTGRQTKFSHIVSALSKTDAPTEFDREIKDFSVLIIKVTFVLVSFVFIVNSVLRQDWLGSLMFAVALAVGMTPEMLPMIIALNLSRGSLEMAKRGVIVKRLSSIQNFGSMDVLCTDKTGTLTEGKITLIKYFDATGAPDETIFRYAYINSRLNGGFTTPLDEAIKAYKDVDITKIKKIDELPFDFERKRESIAVVDGDRQLLITLGAPEVIFAICHNYSKTKKPLTDQVTTAVQEQYRQLSQDGYRVLALAIKDFNRSGAIAAADEADLTLLGLMAFLDPPKTAVAETLDKMRGYQIEIKILTGDNELVTQKIAAELNLPIKGVVLGSELAHLSAAEMMAKVQAATIFARVDPEQKLAILKALQASGHVVGYIGDGINDAPTLKAADVGISVNNAVDVAKESADMIMVKKSLTDLIEAVIEGRRTFANTYKYLRMALSSNFGNMFSMAGASLFLPFLPMLPAQILFNNLLYDTSQFALPLDHVDDEELTKPRRLNLKEIKHYMLVFGPISSVFDFLTFAVLLLVFHFGAAAFQTGWFMESLATQVFVIFVIRTNRRPFWKSRPGVGLVVGTSAAVAVGWLVALSPWRGYFGFADYGLPAVLMIALIVAVYLLAVEAAKHFYRQRLAGQAG